MRGAKLSALTINGELTSSSFAPTGSADGVNTLSISISERLNALAGQVEQAYGRFDNERNNFAASGSASRPFFSALYLTRVSAALSGRQQTVEAVHDRLAKTISYLSMVEDLLTSGSISAQTADGARLVNARSGIIFGGADTRSASNSDQLLVPAGTGVITNTSDATPLTTQVAVASPDAGGSFPFELAGVSVTVGGRAVTVMSVSPTRITFNVPTDLAGGFAEVIVSARDGEISHWAANVIGINPRVFNVTGGGDTAGAIFNAVNSMVGNFNVVTPHYFSADQRTRLTIFSSGISSGVANTDPRNDVTTENGTLPNLAEGVQVEAVAMNGAVFVLPVEYAGAQGQVPGLDQVNVVLPAALETVAGNFSLTIFVNGQRSNSATVTIR